VKRGQKAYEKRTLAVAVDVAIIDVRALALGRRGLLHTLLVPPPATNTRSLVKIEASVTRDGRLLVYLGYI